MQEVIDHFKVVVAEINSTSSGEHFLKRHMIKPTEESLLKLISEMEDIFIVFDKLQEFFNNEYAEIIHRPSGCVAIFTLFLDHIQLAEELPIELALKIQSFKDTLPAWVENLLNIAEIDNALNEIPEIDVITRAIMFLPEKNDRAKEQKRKAEFEEKESYKEKKTFNEGEDEMMPSVGDGLILPEVDNVSPLGNS